MFITHHHLKPSFQHWSNGLSTINKPNQTIYTIITTHNSNSNKSFVEATSSTIADAFDINDDTTIHIGYCRDDALVDTVRVSVMVVG